MRSTRSARPVLSAVAALLLAFAVAGCDDDAGPAVKLSADGAAGKTLAAKFNCQSCHSVDGVELTGPTWQGLYGAGITLKGGKKVTVDADYIERAIREPNAERRDDATGQMPTFDEARISDADLAQIVAYIKDLSASAATK